MLVIKSEILGNIQQNLLICLASNAIILSTNYSLILRPGQMPAHHALSIDKRLASLSSTPIDQQCCVFKVHRHIRQINPAAYEPNLLAIGPYHRGKEQLSFMEKHKLRFLLRMLQRRNENSAERYITAMIKKEERARRFYADQFPELSKDEFAEMMLLDGCFIIELFCSQNVLLDQIFRTAWMIDDIIRDLLLFENQLPFFILTELFEMSEGCNWQYDYAHCESTTSANQSEKNQTVLLGSLSRKSSKHGIDSDQKLEITIDESSMFKDVSEWVPTRLLDLALTFFSSFSELSRELNINGSSHVSTADIKHLLDLIHKSMSPSPKVVPYEETNLILPSVMELQEAGVKFKKAKTGNLFHIKFNNGVMEIPSLNISKNTEPIFRNLIAYEQHSQHIDLKYVTDFATLMDYLIHTPKDVKLLRQNRIMNNWMGHDDEVVSSMFNRFCQYTIFSYKFYYADIIKEVNKHCDRRWNIWKAKWDIWKAKLRRDYFNSPWALLSVLAAVLLLLLAIVQTVFSILSYVFK